MVKKAVIIAGLVLLVLVVFGAGFASGNRWTFRWMMSSLETEVSGSQNFRISQLVYLRSGDDERAVQLLEQQVDTALSTLPQRRPWEDLSQSVRDTLILSKKYRERYPPAEPSKSLSEALAFIPDLPLNPNSCDPGVRHLLEGEAP
jgi:hypothetical protein